MIDASILGWRSAFGSATIVFAGCSWASTSPFELRIEPRSPAGYGDAHAACVLSAARSFAEAERGFAHRSSTLGTTARAVSDRSMGSRPHTHTGKSGGQVQPRAASRMKR